MQHSQARMQPYICDLFMALVLSVLLANPYVQSSFTQDCISEMAESTLRSKNVMNKSQMYDCMQCTAEGSCSTEPWLAERPPRW